MTLRKGRYGKKAFAVLAVAILALTFMTLVLTSVSDSSSSPVYAAPLFQNKDLVFDAESAIYENLSGNYYYDTVLDFGNGVSVDGNYYVSGDFYSTGSFALSKSGNTVYFNNQPTADLNANLGIDPAGDLAAAINDGLVSVQLSLYFIYAAPQNADAGEERATATLKFYDGTGTTENDVFIPNSISQSGSVRFPASETVNSVLVTVCNVSLNKVFADGGYLSIALSNFQTSGNFSVAFKEIGIRTTVSPRTDISLVDGAAGVRVYDQSGYRDAGTDINIIKGGDIVVFNSVIQSGNVKYSLSNANDFATEQNSHGKLYRKLILEGNASETLIRPEYNSGYWERVYSYSYTDADGTVHQVDISDDYSGEIIAFRVKDATVTNLTMSLGLWRANGKNSNVTRTLNFYNVNDALYFVDVPGYGYAKVNDRMTKQFGKTMDEYISERQTLRGFILLVDYRHKPTKDDVMMYQFIKHHDVPVMVVATKEDKLKRNDLKKNEKLIRDTLNMHPDDYFIRFSSLKKVGINEAWQAIYELCDIDFE